ncbi:MAG: hypothetical protein ABI629_25770, partial [bacterium]
VAQRISKGPIKIGAGKFTIIGETSATFDPGSLADGAGETKADIAVAGAAFGDYVLWAAPYSVQGLSVTAYVHAAGLVAIRVQNESGGAVDLASGAWHVKVIR